MVVSGGVVIWVSSTTFQESNIGWPQQALKERVPNISKQMDFWWFIPQKVTGFDHFRQLGARDDLSIRISIIFWWNEAVQVSEATEVVEAVEVMEAAKVLRPENHYWWLQSFRFLNSALFWWFENNFFLESSRILAPFRLEAVEASICLFFENWGMKLKCPNLPKTLGTILQQNYWSFPHSEPSSFVHFNMIPCT